MAENRNDGRIGAMPASINKINPQAAPDALSITALVKRSGRVSGYQLSDGRRITRGQGVRMAKQGQIKGVSIAMNQGTEYLRTVPDSTGGNNLGSLPSVSE